MSGSREALGLLKESLGIASARDGTSTGGLTYDLTKHISGVNFEKAVNHLRPTGSVKSVQLPSPEEATPLGEAPCCGKLLKLDSTTPLLKKFGGTRLMAVPNGNNLSRYMDNPQAYQLSPLWKDMLGSHRLNGCRSTMTDDQSGVGLRYSRAMRESVWVN